MSLASVSAKDAQWLRECLESLNYQGCIVVEDVLSPKLIDQTRDALHRAQGAIHDEVGVERLKAAGELGTLRLPLRYDDIFFSFLELPEVLALVDRTVSATAVLHQINGFVLPSLERSSTPQTYQNSFHRDFPRYLNGYLASINVLFAIDAFAIDNGATMLVPATHQRDERPDEDFLQRNAIPAIAAKGSMLVFDSTLWHAAGRNHSGSDRAALNLQFTRSFFKQQIDYVRALGDAKVKSLSERTQQLLGWHTRVVTSLDEYYQPADKRLYRSEQG